MTQRASEVILYTRPDCHLCELAATMIEDCGVLYTQASVDTDPDLIRQYGTRIPVVYRPDVKRELAWPFTAESLREFIELEI